MSKNQKWNKFMALMWAGCGFMFILTGSETTDILLCLVISTLYGSRQF